MPLRVNIEPYAFYEDFSAARVSGAGAVVRGLSRGARGIGHGASAAAARAGAAATRAVGRAELYSARASRSLALRVALGLLLVGLYAALLASCPQ